MTAYEWLKENRNKISNRTELMKTCRECTGKCQSTVSEALSRLEKNEPLYPRLDSTETADKILPKIKKINDFREMFDVVFKINLALSNLPDDGYLTEMEFREFAGISPINLSRFREKFEANQLKTRDKTYWAKASFIKKMKQVIER